MFVGDRLAEETRGQFLAAPHRVRAGSKPRLSIVLELRMHDLESIESSSAADGPDVLPEHRCLEHRRQRFAKKARQ
eukprot:SAG31_NODE_39281_length_289_cov_1.089474_1_plen_75_part_01